LKLPTILSESGAFQALLDYVRGLRQSGTGLWGVSVELILIGSVVYLALRFLQGTRGARLLKSVGIILVTSFLLVRVVAERLHLDRIVFLYPYFFGAVVLTALIAFQPEIRRGLIRIGGARWLRFWSTTPEPIVDPLVTVVSRLSQKKIGALIAVQRNVGLDAIAETGVRLDAVVTSELLETIFWPGTVLHDMGVIVQHDRVAAAACQFPIAESGDLALSLGSRHRAALGLSHECDALVIVVSEETGTISVALHGKLHRHLTPDALSSMLVGALGLGVGDAEDEAEAVEEEAPKRAKKPAAGVLAGDVRSTAAKGSTES
jgi:diadenylate cyclase